MRKELIIASKQTPTSPIIATYIGIIKIIDKIIINTFTKIEIIIFCFTIFIVNFEISIAFIIEEIESFIKTMSLALIAISDPKEFIAIPQEDLIKHAASLIPSPT